MPSTWPPRPAGELLECAELLYALSAHLDFDRLLTSVTALERGDRWHALARQALRDDLYRSLRLLTADVLSTTSGDQDAQRKIEQWEDENASRLARARRTLGEIAAVVRRRPGRRCRWRPGRSGR